MNFSLLLHCHAFFHPVFPYFTDDQDFLLRFLRAQRSAAIPAAPTASPPKSKPRGELSPVPAPFLFVPEDFFVPDFLLVVFFLNY